MDFGIDVISHRLHGSIAEEHMEADRMGASERDSNMFYGSILNGKISTGYELG